MKRSGTADLPLHGGRVPPWLAERMTNLGTAIAEQVVYFYGPGGFLTRLNERDISASLGGRSVFNDAISPQAKKKSHPQQGSLFP